MFKAISFSEDEVITHRHTIIYSPNDDNFSFHTHGICELIFLKSGNISAVIGEKSYKMSKDSLVFFRTNIPHRIRIDGSENYERYNILFNENKVANGIFHKLPKELDVINCNEKRQIQEIFEKLTFITVSWKMRIIKSLLKTLWKNFCIIFMQSLLRNLMLTKVMCIP